MATPRKAPARRAPAHRAPAKPKAAPAPKAEAPVVETAPEVIPDADLAPEEVEPIDTDNSVRPEDGEQDVSQDVAPVEGSPSGDDE